MKKGFINRFIFRTDAGTVMGYGHLMRSIALAQGLYDKGSEIVFLVSQISPDISRKLSENSFELQKINSVPGSAEDAAETVSAAQKLNARWISVDGYHFTSAYQQILKNAGLKVLFIDDYGHCDHYYADIILNQNISADAAFYTSKENHCKLLLGTDYVLLRREFRALRGFKRKISPELRNVLISMGGGDPFDITSFIIRAITSIENTEKLHIKAVLGAANQNHEKIAELAESLKCRIDILSDVNNISELMQWADIMFSASGSTSWEIALLGLPSILITFADNQRPLAQKLSAKGAAIYPGHYDILTADKLKETFDILSSDAPLRGRISEISSAIVDGLSLERVINEIYESSISIRSASSEDCKLLWEWANEALVRKFSYNSAPIPFEDHCIWFDASLKNPNRIIFILNDINQVPFAQVRFDIENNLAETGISISGTMRGMGLAAIVISKAVRELSRLKPELLSVEAFIKDENQASAAAFARAGFQTCGMELKNNFKSIHMSKRLK